MIELPHVLHRETLLSDGFTDEEIRAKVREGHWITVYPGAYVAAPAVGNLTEERRYAVRSIAIAQRSPDLVLSHWSAASILGLPLSGTRLDAVHLTRAGRGGNRIGRDRIVHSGRVDAHEVVPGPGARLTTTARTLVDLARSAPLETAVVAADFALREGLVTGAELAEALTAARSWRGAAAARRALQMADGRSESPGETRTRLVLVQAGLARPALQISVYGPNGEFIGRSDLGYPEMAVLIEFDGRVKYSALLRPGEQPQDVVLAEKRREDLLRELGFIIVRIVWSDLSEPDAIVERIGLALERGAAVMERGGTRGSWRAAAPIWIG